MNRGILGPVGTVVLALALLHAREAGAYPDLDLKLINPYPATGPADITGDGVGNRVARMMQSMSPASLTDALAWSISTTLAAGLGRRVIVERRARVRTIEGHRQVALATPDGHTLLLSGDSAFLVHPKTARELAFDPVRDLVPVALVARMPIVLIASRRLGVTTAREFIAAAKAAPRPMHIGSAGGLSTTHLAAELMMERAGIDLVRVAFNGGTAAVDNVMTGQIEAAFVPLPAVLPYLYSERLRVIGIAEPERDLALPHIPALAKTIPGFDAAHWYGVFAPAGTPRSVVSLLSEKLASGVAPPATSELLASRGLRITYLAAAEFSAKLVSERARWRSFIARRAGASGT